ncbi:Early nodulin 93 ENOD93 protein [Dillenia turbinata]|uniref:Early nodulin 93 ENOD93 protein n=1 Tax=Dillenia turbinata TaxID=194707 RepID=A0AAN8Z9J8_9MAGN
MGIRESWNNINNRKSLFIPSAYEEAKLRRSTESTNEGVRAGAKAAAIGFVASAIPTLIAVRKIRWAKENINHTGQALIVSAASAAAFFVAADKTILESARRNAEYKKKA